MLDWDGLAIGDPAEDYATVAFPLLFRCGKDWRDIIPSESLGARIDLYVRAIALDSVIDALADWVECDVPEWIEQVRQRKHAEHVTHLAWYLERWG